MNKIAHKLAEMNAKEAAAASNSEQYRLGPFAVKATEKKDSPATPESVDARMKGLVSGWKHRNTNPDVGYRFDNFRRGRNVRTRLDIDDPAGRYTLVSRGQGRRNQRLTSSIPLISLKREYANPEDAVRMDTAASNYNSRMKKRDAATVMSTLGSAGGGGAIAYKLTKGRPGAAAVTAGAGLLGALIGGSSVGGALNKSIRKKYFKEMPVSSADLLGSVGGSVSKAISQNAERGSYLKGLNA